MQVGEGEIGEPSQGICSYVPVPESSITCGLVEALSMMVIVPCAGPFFVGENVALMAQFAPAATVAPQFEVMPNSSLAFIDLIVSAVEPQFVSVTVSGELFVPTG